MTTALPRIGYRSILHKYASCLYAPYEDSTYPAANAVNWRHGERWRGPWGNNELPNGDFLAWTGSNPDGWTRIGAGSSWAKLTQSSSPVPQVPPIGLSLTRSGTNCQARYDFADFALRKGKTYEIRGWSWASVASQARLYLEDGVNTAFGALHVGNSQWSHSVTRMTVSHAATRFRVETRVLNTNGTAHFCGIQIVEVPGNVVTAPADPAPSEPITCDLYVFPEDGQELTDPLFTSWPNGSSSAPAGWTLSGSGSVRRGTTTKVGPASVELVGSGGGTTMLTWPLPSSALERAKGRKIGSGCHIYASNASFARLRIIVTARDGASQIIEASGYNDGDSDFDWETKAAVHVPYDAVSVSLQFELAAIAASAFFSGPLFHISSDTPAATPHAKSVDYVAGFDHNLFSSGRTLYVHGSNDNWTTETLLATVAATSDRAFMKTFNPASYGSIRTRIEGGTGKDRLRLGVLAVGLSWELPEELSPGHDPFLEEYETEIPTSEAGTPLGSSSIEVPGRLVIEQEWPTTSWIQTEFREFYEHAGGRGPGPNGLPFFYLFDPGDYPAECRLLMPASRSRLSAPLELAMEPQRVRIEAMTVPEFAL